MTWDPRALIYGEDVYRNPQNYSQNPSSSSSGSSGSSSSRSGSSGSSSGSSGSSSSSSSKAPWEIKLEQLANDPAGLQAEIQRTANVLATKPTAEAGDWLSKLSGLAKQMNKSGTNVALTNYGSAPNPNVNAPVYTPQNTVAGTVQTGQNQSNPYLIPLQQWFAGKDIANSGGTLNVGGFNFVPGSYITQDGQYYINPMNLAAAYMTKPQLQMTPEMYNQALDTAKQYYDPQRQSKMNALKQALKERSEAARRGVISRGTYTSPVYAENIKQEVDKPYAQDLVNLETNLSGLESAMAMDEVNKKIAADKDLTTAIVNFLLGVNDNAQNMEWQKVLQSLTQQGNILNA